MSIPPQAAPNLADQGAAFFVDVPLGSPDGSDAVNYSSTATPCGYAGGRAAVAGEP